MVRNYFVATLALLFVGCTAGSIGTEPPEQESTLTITGYVSDGVCTRRSDATVSVLDSEDNALSDPSGNFELSNVPKTGVVLQVTGEGVVPTLTPVLDFIASGTELEVPVIVNTIAYSVHLLAGYDWEEQGTVVIAALTPEDMPIVGAKISLRDAEGTDVGKLFYIAVEPDRSAYLVNATGATNGTLGAAGIFGVEDGTYTASVTADGYDFKDLQMVVRKGAISFGPAIGVLRDNAEPSIESAVLTGKVLGRVPFPNYSPDNAGIAGETVTLYAGPNKELQTTVTDAEGNYRFEMDFVRELYDITVGQPPYIRKRTYMQCVEMGGMKQDVGLGSTFNTERWQRQALGSELLDNTTGQIWAFVRGFDTDLKLWSDIEGTTLSLDPPRAEPFYGEARDTVAQCGVQSCAGGCPTGTRCQEDECVLGETGLGCSLCDDTNACPEGYTPASKVTNAAGSAQCYCIAERDNCADTVCPEGTYCWTDLRRASVASSFTIGNSYCYPYATRLSSTALSKFDDTFIYVRFPNVPPGTYTLNAVGPDGALPPSIVRVDAGVTSLAYIRDGPYRVISNN